MGNLIQADLFRMSKGRTVRTTVLGLLIVMMIVMVISIVLSNGSLLNSLEPRVDTPNELAQDMAEMHALVPTTGPDLVLDILSDTIIAFFILPISLAVFGKDFSAGTYRNTLSFESDRKKVYLSKLISTTLVAQCTILIALILGGLIGSLVLGVGDLNGAYFTRLFIILLLQFPLNVALVCLYQCVIAFTKKSGAAIAIILVYLFVSTSVVQLMMLLVPDLRMIKLLDMMKGYQVMAFYDSLPKIETIAFLLISGAMMVISTVVGLWKYGKSDMD